jgi:2,4-dienoyl-CoA reductase-like NADH-dependent reductase (Old Yellow Enzyme family)
MSREEIQRCIQEHCRASLRALEAGFDGVEITAFMGYLLANFLSPFTNRRTDDYGGSLENRGRFMVELLRAIREAIGKDKLLIIRLNGDELMDEHGGNSQAECIALMKMAEQAGVDCISIVVGWHVSVVATGSEIESIAIPGVQLKHVMLAHEILEEGSPCGDRVVVLGGERIGLVAAEYLASRGKQVTLIEAGKRLGEDVIATFKWRHAAWVRELQIQALLNTHAKEITAEGVVVEDATGAARLVPADTVILAISRKPRQQLLTDLEFVCDELYVIGDAVKPRSMHNAIREGYLIGMRI